MINCFLKEILEQFHLGSIWRDDPDRGPRLRTANPEEVVEHLHQEFCFLDVAEGESHLQSTPGATHACNKAHLMSHLLLHPAFTGSVEPMPSDSSNQINQVPKGCFASELQSEGANSVLLDGRQVVGVGIQEVIPLQDAVVCMDSPLLRSAQAPQESRYCFLGSCEQEA